MTHHSNTVVGSGPSVIRRFLLTEDAEFSMPPDATLLYSEVVVDGKGSEVLQVWLAVPTASADSTGQTIYTNTVVHEDDSAPMPSNFETDDDWGDGEDEYYYD